MDLSDVDAVLLDMDGTLVDSDAAVERAWTAWAAEYGVDAATAVVRLALPLAGDLPLDDLGRLAHLLTRARVRPWWRDAAGFGLVESGWVDPLGAAQPGQSRDVGRTPMPRARVHPRTPR
ncbi:hypothetical protein AB0O34_26285 [Sphaerisporangium sp. NPDC088356]|uniref:hypothetical protein n=1 Tax=Sphaerisporangium sp. NPDC088356 TaxID=3154871 RepID=UPI00343784B7